MCSSGFGAAKKLSLCSRFGFSAPRCMGSSPTHRYSPHYSYNRMNQVPQAAQNATSGQLMSLLSARETCNLKSHHLLLRRSSFSICLPSFVGFLSFFLFFSGQGVVCMPALHLFAFFPLICCRSSLTRSSRLLDTPNPP